MEYHKYANLFPMMTDDEHQSLVEDIKKNGLLNPIWVYEGQILDGRNRWRACQELGIEPAIREWAGQDPISFVVSLNLNRRHLTSGQRAVLALDIQAALEEEARDRQRKGNYSNNDPHLRAILPEDEGKNLKRPRQQAAEIVGSSARYVQDAKRIKRQAPELLEEVKEGTINLPDAKRLLSSDTEEREAVLEKIKTGKAKNVKAAKKVIEEEREKPKKGKIVITLNDWKTMTAEQQAKACQVPTNSTSTFNKQKNESIEWARWSWNPVTGCKHNCPYCYARDIANRFYNGYGFQPAFHPDRLAAPNNVKVPKQAEQDITYKNVFTCSMADLFGRWVPQAWIDAVLDVVKRSPQWNFMLLTKFPIRLSEQQWPSNAIVGASIDTQSRVKATMKAFRRVKERTNAAYTWLSLEPLLEPLQFESLEMFDLIVIGGASKSNLTPKWVPPTSWSKSLLRQADRDGCQVFMKENLEYRRRELPWGSARPEPTRAPDAFFLKP